MTLHENISRKYGELYFGKEFNTQSAFEDWCVYMDAHVAAAWNEFDVRLCEVTYPYGSGRLMRVELVAIHGI